MYDINDDNGLNSSFDQNDNDNQSDIDNPINHNGIDDREDVGSEFEQTENDTDNMPERYDYRATEQPQFRQVLVSYRLNDILVIV